MGKLTVSPFFFFFLSSNFYPGGHPFGQAGWLPTTQVFKGSLLLESGKDEKEKLRESVELRSQDQLAKCPVNVQYARRQERYKLEGE